MQQRAAQTQITHKPNLSSNLIPRVQVGDTGRLSSSRQTGQSEIKEHSRFRKPWQRPAAPLRRKLPHLDLLSSSRKAGQSGTKAHRGALQIQKTMAETRRAAQTQKAKSFRKPDPEGTSRIPQGDCHPCGKQVNQRSKQIQEHARSTQPW